IHNHKDHLGKFDEKVNDGYLLGYSLVSKAFRVFNTRRKQTKETYYVTFDKSLDAIKFLKSLVDDINIAETERYLPDEYLHPYEPSQRYQTNNNDVSFIEPYESPEPVVLETESKHSNHTNDEKIIDNLPNTEDIHISEHLSSPSVEDTSVQNTILIPNPSLSIPSMVTPAPQYKWYQDKHIDLVNIIGIPGARMLTRAIAKELSAASAHECLFVDFLSKEEPKKVSEALQHPEWVDTMQDELNQFSRNKVWTLVSAPYGKTIIGSKWQEGIDYDEIFDPVARFEAIRIFLAFATYMNFIVYQIDVKSAFLNGKLKEEVYVKQPPGFKSSEFPNHVCKLDKALYGLKQAPRAWYETLLTYLSKYKFVREMEQTDKGVNTLKSCLKVTQIRDIDGTVKNKDGTILRPVRGAPIQPKPLVKPTAEPQHNTGWEDPLVNAMQTKETNYSKPSFVNVVNGAANSSQNPKIKFRPLTNAERVDNFDFVLPVEAVKAVIHKFENSLVGFFVGKKVAFPLVKNYVTNTWAKFSFEKVISDDDGLFYFKFATSKGLEQVIKQGPWIIRNIPLMLTKWSPNMVVSKDKVTRVPVWVKLHKVPVVAYSEDSLSLITTQIENPIMLDAFTSSMCVDVWGRMGYARALIEVNANKELKQEVIMVVPNIEKEGTPAVESDAEGFTIVVNRKSKGKGPIVNQKHSGGFKVNNTKQSHVWEPVKHRKNGPKDTKKKNSNGEKTKGPNEAAQASTSMDQGNGVKLKNLYESLNSHEAFSENLNIDDPNGGFVYTSIPDDTGGQSTYDVEMDSEVEEALHVKIIHKATTKTIFYSFIYVGNKQTERRHLWDELGTHKSVVRNYPWVLMGDFNVALNIEDTYTGTSSMSSGMCEFKDCITNIEVVDVTSSGLHYTWNQKPKGYRIMPRRFLEVVEDVWKSNIEGHNMFRVVTKMKMLKKPLQKLLHDQGNLHEKVNRLRTELDEVQKALDVNPADNNLRDEECAYVQAFNEAKIDEERFLKQKTKVDWLATGDSNSAYFHKSIKCRNQRSRIESILNSENQQVPGSLVHEVFIGHYEQSLGSSTNCQSLNMEGLFSKSVLVINTTNMIRVVTNKEIKAAMFDIGVDKAPGPDGFTSGQERAEARRPSFSLFIHIDDLFIFAHGDLESSRVIMDSLEEFKNSSGLAAILNIMPFSEGDLSVKYLGIPLISSGLLNRDCKVLVEKAKNKIRDWKNKSLSFAGRLQLCKSVISSMHVYWASVLIIPKGIIYDIHQLIRGFLWCNGELKRGKAKIAWEDIYRPTREGGLGIRNLEVFNYDLMTTHIWNILSFKESLWVRWIHKYKLRGRTFWDILVKNEMSWGWRKLLQLRDVMRPFFWVTLGNGMSTSIWYDKWCMAALLCQHLSHRDISREGFNLTTKVADLIANGTWSWPQAWLHKAPILNSIPIPVLDPLGADVTHWRD
ncbi:retrovirus-related pol polyprotein from transposon TNT 1-94, partial [Tanacetum coccineum]